MLVLLAEEMGMCFGVRDALKIIDGLERPGEVTIHGQLVHNEAVLAQLVTRGFRMAGEDHEHLPATQTVLVTAHGISDRERARLATAGKTLIDTTCPLVERVHRAARQLQNEGYHVVLIGRPGNVEVRGVVEDLHQFDVIESPSQARAYPSRQLAVLSQTTAPPRTVTAVHAAIVAANPEAEVRFIDTTCQPTRQRQRSVEKLLPHVQCMVIVGGKNSNNTRELADLCRERGVASYLVQSAADLRREWFYDIDRVGLTAGTSTLDATIVEVRDWLREFDRNSNTSADRAWSSENWCEYFQQNALTQRPIPWHLDGSVPEEEREILAGSLAAWQLGETSDGRHLLESAKSYARRMNDPGFVDAVRLFIKEEQRHGEMLGRCLDRAGVPRLQSDWGDFAFRTLRYFLPNFECWATPVVMVETIALIYYNAIRRLTRSEPLRAVCAQILSDEVPHIRFQSQHLARLHAGRSRWLRACTRLIHVFLFTGIVLAVWAAHHRALKAGGYPFRVYWRAAWRKMRTAWEMIGQSTLSRAGPGVSDAKLGMNCELHLTESS